MSRGRSFFSARGRSEGRRAGDRGQVETALDGPGRPWKPAKGPAATTSQIRGVFRRLEAARGLPIRTPEYQMMRACMCARSPVPHAGAPKLVLGAWRLACGAWEGGLAACKPRGGHTLGARPRAPPSGDRVKIHVTGRRRGGWGLLRGIALCFNLSEDVVEHRRPAIFEVVISPAAHIWRVKHEHMGSEDLEGHGA